MNKENNMSNIAIIHRGVVGSGKSTLGARLLELCEEIDLSCSIHNTDQYFMVDGEYKFDPSKLGSYHMSNLSTFQDCCRQGVNVVVADNTNLRSREYKKYVQSAKEHGYKVIAVVFVPDTVETHLERNTHNVPKETVERFVDTLNQNLDTNGVDMDIKFHPNVEGKPFEDRIDTLAQSILRDELDGDI